MKITCIECNARFELSSKTMIEKPHKRNFFDVGILCPKCDHFIHGFFTNTVLERRKKELSNLRDRLKEDKSFFDVYQKKLEKFQLFHDKMQKVAAKL